MRAAVILRGYDQGQEEMKTFNPAADINDKNLKKTNI